MRPVDLAAFLEHLARRSGEAILPFFRSHFSIDNKARGGGFDPVTESDRAAETLIRRLIAEALPAHGIKGEEFPDHQPEAEYVWVIDPIDGTRAFLCGLPVWGTLIGLTRNGQPVLGAMHQPFTGELFVGGFGGAFLKQGGSQRALRTRATAELAEARLMTTDPGLFSEDEARAFAGLRADVRLTRYGADCYAYAMLAAGQIDLVVEAGLKPYDIVPLVPIIEAAGGVVSTWDGRPATEGGRILAAANPALHERALRRLAAGLAGV